jgi:hypothetical protein
MPRFSLYCLEDGDEYLGDTPVAYTVTASSNAGSPTSLSHLEKVAGGTQSAFLQGYGRVIGTPTPGRLRLAGRTVCFDPDDENLPILTMRLRDVTIVQKGSPAGQQGDAGLLLSTTAVRLQMANGRHHVHVVDTKVASGCLHRFDGMGAAVPRSFHSRLTLAVDMNAADAPAVQRSKAIEAVQEATEAQVPFSFSWLSSALEKIVLQLPCHRIAPFSQERGRIVVTTRAVYFQPTFALSAKQADAFPIAQMVRVANRRTSFVDRAVELAVRTSTTTKAGSQLSSSGGEAGTQDLAMFRFRSAMDRNKFVAALKRSAEELKPRPEALLSQFGDNLPRRIEAMCRSWMKGAVSNFDYLMFLNWCAGRTFSDVAQYPVLPWVVRDYKSPNLDLSDPSVYRDLSKPIGALNPQRLASFKQRAKELEAMGEDPYLYGSHYSSPGYVTYWLLRDQPEFTLMLHGGRFEHPSRIFESVPSAFESVMNGPTDLKELIPHFYFGAGQLLTTHGSTIAFRDIGMKGDGSAPAADVVLPPWASSPADFIQQHRKALESEHVSRHIHEWIDLIFGCAQSGEEAWKRDNVFHPMSYETARGEIDRIQDPAEREALATHIREFGQVPLQLFSAPHPKRLCGATPDAVINPQSFMPDTDTALDGGSPVEVSIAVCSSIGGTESASSLSSSPALAKDGKETFTLLPSVSEGSPAVPITAAPDGTPLDASLPSTTEVPVQPIESLRIVTADDPYAAWLSRSSGESGAPQWRPRQDPVKVCEGAIRSLSFITSAAEDALRVLLADVSGGVFVASVDGLAKKPTPVPVHSSVGAVLTILRPAGDASPVATLVARNGTVVGIDVSSNIVGKPPPQPTEVTNSILRAADICGPAAPQHAVLGGRDGALKLVAMSPITGMIVPVAQPRRRLPTPFRRNSDAVQTEWDLESALIAVAVSPGSEAIVALNEEGGLFGLGDLDALAASPTGSFAFDPTAGPRFASRSKTECTELPEDAAKGPEDVLGMWFVGPTVIAVLSYTGRLTLLSVAYDTFGDLLGASAVIAAFSGASRVSCALPLKARDDDLYPSAVVIGGRGGVAAIFDIKSGKLRCPTLSTGGMADVVALSASGRRLAVGDSQGTLHVFVATFA